MTVTDPHIIVHDDGLSLKFDRTLSVGSLVNASFVVTTQDATPTVLVNPFVHIQVSEDYNSISRVIRLYFLVTDTSLWTASSTYKLQGFGLSDSAGNPIPVPDTASSISYLFVTNPTLVIEVPAPTDPIYVEDHSVRTDLFTDFNQIIQTNPNFYVVSTIPELVEPIVDPTFNNGRIVIEFSQTPNGVYLNDFYFKVQYQPLQRGLSRWVTVTNTVISMDGQKPLVYIDMPSYDATPSYNTPGGVYYTQSNKYRVKISKDVGT